MTGVSRGKGLSFHIVLFRDSNDGGLWKVGRDVASPLRRQLTEQKVPSLISSNGRLVRPYSSTLDPNSGPKRWFNDTKEPVHRGRGPEVHGGHLPFH